MQREHATAARTSRLRLRIFPAAESKLRAGHPWLYSDSIKSQNRPGIAGELAVIYDARDRFLAAGLFDPHSPIRVRILHLGKAQPLDESWWDQRLQQTLERRRHLFDAQTTGYRWINGESDGFPGLVLDRYAETLVLKLYTAAWLPRLDDAVRLIQRRLQPRGLVLRLSRNIQAIARDEFNRRDGDILSGPPIAGAVVFLENGLRFEADVLRGQKTGFFLDQRENRRQVEGLARERVVLNAFSFSGGFSLYAARGGATSVTDLDLSAHALTAAQRNFSLNADNGTVHRCRHHAIKADAFEWLPANLKRKFDLVVLDPPSLAKRQSERPGAIRAYRQLAGWGIQLLNKNGILLACSCSAHVTAPEFFSAVRQVAQTSGRPVQELATMHHAADHPAAFQEAEYLKSIYLQLG